VGFDTQQEHEIFVFRRDTDELWGPPILLFNGYQRFFPLGCNGWGMNLITHLHIVLRLRMSRAIYVLSHMPSGICWDNFTLLPLTDHPLRRL
jgi:hypothetical protein